MDRAKLKCEKCGTILEITSKIIDGKNLKCPRCKGTIFMVINTIEIADDPLTKKLVEEERNLDQHSQK